MNKYLLPCFCFLWFAVPLWAQKITITGTIIDDDTEEPVAFANVFFQGTEIGVNSDLEGVFTIEFDPAAVPDSLVANSLGYTDLMKKVDKTLTIQTINYRLKSSDYVLPTFTVVAGENPANEIIRNIIKAKKRNNPAAYEAYKTELYSKVELDLDDISPDMKNKKMFKEFQFIFDNVDSTSDVKPFLPAYVAERLYDVYYVKKFNERKEMLKAQKVSGINNTSVVEFIDMMHEKYNVYENWITLLGKEFVSPFSNSGLGYYEYYILDSTFIKGAWSYKLKFKPRRKQENTFYGDFWVSMKDHAVQIVNMRMSPDANINLVNRVIIYAEFEQNKDSLWLPSKEKTVIDFSSNAKDKGLSIIGRTTYSYKNFELGEEVVTNQDFRKMDPNGIVAANLNQDETFWKTARHDSLTKNEEGVYKMIDSIKSVPIYRTWSNVLTLLGTGFQVVGPVEVGPYWNLINYNRCEGNRFGLGVGTSTKLSKKTYLYGYFAYGLADKRLKYSAQYQYVFNKEKRTKIGGRYANLVDFESVNSEETAAQSLGAGWLRRPVMPKIFLAREAKVFYQQGYKNGFQTRLALVHRDLIPQERYFVNDQTGYRYVFQNDPNDSTKIDTSFRTFETVFTFRFAYRERLLLGNFSSISLGSKYPIVSAQYTAGIKGVLGSMYNYHKFAITLDDWFNVGIAGWVDYNVKMGTTLGRIPYFFAETHPGNEAYFYNNTSFNSMNSFEFASDMYFSWKIEHHMDGLILDKIPLIRRLKWRTVWAFRGVWGRMSERNLLANRFNHLDYSGNRMGATGTFRNGFGNTPYMEASVGIENILKVIRVDALWRLTHLDNINPQLFPIQKFTLRMTLNFNF